MRKSDLIGKRFGSLTVLERAGTHESPNGSKTSLWRCRCDCGNEVTVLYQSLKDGKTKSCGCARELGKIRWAKDRSGEWYGQLEVIKRIGENERRDPLWLCKCHRCGGEAVVAGSKLSSRKDCGCSYLERCSDLSGKSFGGITVISQLTSRSPAGDIEYLCRCNICGKEKVFPACTIRAIPKSCGCLMHTKERMQELSKAGVSAAIVDGANINSIFAGKANRNSHTGVRGVYPDRNGTYRASCQVAGELWVRAGFASVETAAAARKEVQQELIEKYGVKPRKEKEKNDK